MGDAHGSFGYPGPPAIFFSELGIHVRNPAFIANLRTVLTPEERECYTIFGQFTMYPLVIRYGVWGSKGILPGKQQFLEILVGDIIIQWPEYPRRFCGNNYCSNSVSGTLSFQSDAATAVTEILKSQNLAVVNHKTTSLNR